MFLVALSKSIVLYPNKSEDLKKVLKKVLMKNIFVLKLYLEKHDASKLIREGEQYFSNVEALQSFFLAKKWHRKWN